MLGQLSIQIKRACLQTPPQQHTSCSDLWKCLTRLFAASLRSSWTSRELIPEKTNSIRNTSSKRKETHKDKLCSRWANNEVSQLLCWRVRSLPARTAPAAKRSQHGPHTLRRRRQLRRGSCPLPTILFCTRRHQLTNEDSFQAAVTHSLPQPSATREPTGNKRNNLLQSVWIKWFTTPAAKR